MALLFSLSLTDPNTAITFLEKTKEKVKASEEAVILCKTVIGSLKLDINDLPATKKLIEEVEEMLNALPGVTSVHGRFYDLSSKYYRIIGNHALYYKDALRYLGCVDVKDLPGAEQQERAFTLGLAGLLGEGVYNFGELLMHPVLESLKNTDKQWLIETLYAFNSGNVEKFQALKSAWGQQPDLAAQETKLMQKIQLLCVMEVRSHSSVHLSTAKERAEQQERAFTLGLAGLLGEGVYNFGELLMHPVLESLKNTDKQWLIETLYAFNSGNVEKFQALKSAWGQQPDLAAQETKLMQKIQLLCVMEMTFTRPANHRQLTFQEISQSTRVPVNEVELLVMKALSVGLLRGSIDEVDQRVQMTWVQPRVLDLPQIKGMKERLDFWCGDVKSMAVLVEHQAQDILT
ncbi:hypothetical protein PGIGA_G00239800 [Pangasianodon gigas]|uniref:Uncharacterized protein n=1 Tax=Pangasianodon gigas TaxID=30993 RepID=A0ACC5WNI2_PANGG|nr:hypothetical protein [Pangasianodon gigas]